MTLIIAFHCRDGSVLASDSMLTNSMGGIQTAETKGQKLHALRNKLMLAWAGDGGLASRLIPLVEQFHIDDGSDDLTISVSFCHKLIHHFQSTNLKFPLNLNCVICGAIAGRHFTYRYDGLMQPEIMTQKPYWVTFGSGKQFADPFLRFLTDIFCPNHQPSTDEARFLATWAMLHTIEANAGGVNGPAYLGELSNRTDYVPVITQIDEESEAIGEIQVKMKAWYDETIMSRSKPNRGVPKLGI